MKRIEAIVRPERLNLVKAALSAAGAKGWTVIDVHGRGEQNGIELINRAGRYRVDLLPKTMIVVVSADDQVERFIDAIVQSARTGDIGDGKIFVTDVERSIRIRTGEADDMTV